MAPRPLAPHTHPLPHILGVWGLGMGSSRSVVRGTSKAVGLGAVCWEQGQEAVFYL